MQAPTSRRRRPSFRPVSGASLAGALFLAAVGLVAGLGPGVEWSSPVQAQSTRQLSGLEQELALAKRLLRSGQTVAAMEKLRALNEAHPADTRVLQIYAAQLRKEERLADAIPLYRRAVEESSEPGPILQELEGIYRELRRDAEAFEVALEYQDRFGERGRWVQRELESLILTGRLGEAAVAKIDKALAGRGDDSPLHRLRLTALYFAGRKEEAQAAAAALDRKRGARGAELFAYATLLEEKGELSDALLALEAAVLSDPEPGLGEEMLYTQAQLLRRLRRIEDALATYDRMVAQHPESPLVKSVLLEKAHILENELRRKDEAIAAYEDLLERIQPVRTAEDAQLVNRVQLSMADCHLLLGRPEKAGELYQQMADNATDPAVRVEALYQVAEMLFYQGRAQEAQESYYKIVDDYKTSSWTNDALERILIIDENNDFGGVPLSALAQAQYYRRLGEVQRALSMIDDALGGFPESEAIDNLLFEKTSLHLVLGKPEEARTAAEQLATDYPESTFAPRGLKIVGDYYREMTGGQAAAKEIYTDILLRFPKAIEVPEVRARLDELEGRGLDSSALEGETLDRLERSIAPGPDPRGRARDLDGGGDHPCCA